MNPRSLANTPQTLNSSNAHKILTSTITPKNLKFTNAHKIVNSAKAPKTPEMTMNTMYDVI